MLNADRFTPIDDTSIPTGELRAVKGTPMDFILPQKIGARINESDLQLKNGTGYDHNFVLNKRGQELSFAGRLSDPGSGRTMEVYTTEPGMQVYTGNFIPPDAKTLQMIRTNPNNVLQGPATKVAK